MPRAGRGTVKHIGIIAVLVFGMSAIVYFWLCPVMENDRYDGLETVTVVEKQQYDWDKAGLATGRE